MTTDSLRTALKAQPFLPLILRTADQREYRIDHPEMAMMSKGGRTVAVNFEGNAFTIIDLLLVTSLEVNAPR